MPYVNSQRLSHEISYFFNRKNNALFVGEFVIVFFPAVTTGKFVIATQLFVKFKFVLASKENPVALVVHEMTTGPFVRSLIDKRIASTMKFDALTPVPAGATTLIGPVVAFVGTMAVS